MRTFATAVLIMALTCPAHAAESDQLVLQNGLAGYDGCTVVPDVQRAKIDMEDGPQEIRIRFGLPSTRLRTAKPRVLKAQLDLFYLYEWWTAYKHDVRCVDASPGGTLGSTVTIVGERTGKGTRTPGKRFLTWDLPPALVQRWLDDPASNQGLRLYFAASKLLDKNKGGGKELGFMGNAPRLARYRPRLSITYEGDLRPTTPHWVTDFTSRRMGGASVLRWRAPAGEAVFDIDMETHGAWKSVASNLPKAARQYTWQVSVTGPIRLRIRAHQGERVSPWCESARFEAASAHVPFRLSALRSVLKVRRQPPLEFPSASTARIELARNEEEGVQLVIDQEDRELKNVTVAASDLIGPGGNRIQADRIKIWPVGYVKTVASGLYLTARDGWFADVLLNIKRFDVPAETVQPVWVSFRAQHDTVPGIYKGHLAVKADGVGECSLPLAITIWNFTLSQEQSLPVLMWGGTNYKTYGLKQGSKEAATLARAHEDLLLAHRMTPGWLLKRFTWAKANLPRNADGTFDFTEFDTTAERLMAGGMTRFFIAQSPRLGKWGFPNQYSADWKRAMREYLAAMCAHLHEKGWLDRAVYYSIDEAAPKEWASCKMLYKLVKSIDPKLTVFQTLNEPRAIKQLVDHADIINVNLRQYHKAGIPSLQKGGKETWWYMCCWPNENPNLFIEYPGIDPRIIPWMTWKYKTQGIIYWQTMAWNKAFDNMGDKRYVDQIQSQWFTAGFGRYNGDGSLLYPGPDFTILRSVRIENLRDGLEDYAYLALLKDKLDRGGLSGKAMEAARELLAIDDRICDMQFGYELDGTRLLEARQRMAALLEAGR